MRAAEALAAARVCITVADSAAGGTWRTASVNVIAVTSPPAPATTVTTPSGEVARPSTLFSSSAIRWYVSAR